MSKVGAWVTMVDEKHRAALGVRELLHIVPEPHMSPVPRAPRHCQSVLRWEGKLLPVVDLAVLFERRAPQSAYPYVGIVGYRAPGETTISFGGIAFNALPAKVELPNGSGCALPDELMHWRPWVHACFNHNGPVPVLHLPSLFKPFTSE